MRRVQAEDGSWHGVIDSVGDDAPVRRPRATGGRQSKASADMAKLDAMEIDLTGLLATVGAFTSMALPVTGTVVLNRAERGGHALRQLAERNPRVRMWLERALGASVWGNIMGLGADVAVAMAVDARLVRDEALITMSIRPEIETIREAEDKAQKRAAAERAAQDGATAPLTPAFT